MNEQKSKAEVIQEIKLKGNQLVDKVREVIEEGNARRVVIKKDDRVLLEFPLSFGVGGAAAALYMAPTLAALGAIGALVADISVVIEHNRKEGDELIVTPNEKDKTETTI